MRKQLLLVFSCAIAAMAANVTFQADFEGTADGFANGRRITPVFLQDKRGFLDKGISGKAIKIGPWLNMQIPETTDAKDCNFGYYYNVKGLVSSKRGAVSFWVSPADWDGPSSAKHKMFCTLRSADQKNHFTIYKVLQKSAIYLYWRSGSQKASVSLVDITKWKKNDWHYIVFCWDNGAYTFFVDGALANTGGYTPLNKEFEQLCLGSINWQLEVGASLMDEVRLYDTLLTQDEVMESFRKTLKVPEVERIISVGKSSPKTDGIVNNGEYPFTGTGFMAIGGLGLHEKQSRYSIGHDGKRLCLSVVSPISHPPRLAGNSGKDQHLWEDESIEWHIFVPSKGLFQFIVNPADLVFDSLDRRVPWDSRTFESKSTVKDGVWTLECSVALEELGCIDGKLSMNLARSFKDPDVNTCIAAVKKNMGYADKKAFINLNLLDSPIVPVTMDNFALDPNKLQLSISSKASFDALVTSKRGMEPLFEKKAAGLKFNAKTDKFIGGSTIVIRLSRGEHTLYQNEFAMGNTSGVVFTLHYLYTDLDTEDIIFKSSSFYPESERGMLRLIVSDIKGNKVAEKEYNIRKLGTNFDISYPGASLPYGYYNFKGYHIAPDGSETAVFDEDWCRPEKHDIPDFLSTDYIKIQPPWTPLVQKDSSIDALVKTYEFGDAFLLSKVIANGNSLLAAPMRLEINGSDVCKAKPPKFDNHGDFCFITQEADYNGIKILTNSRMDYDGLVKVKMTITPPEGGCTLSSVKMLMPFDDNIVKYINGNSSNGNASGCSGLLSDEPWAENLFSRSTFWIGDLKSGFAWVADNMKGWHCEEVDKSLVITKEGQLRTACINIVDKPFAFNAPRTIEFGIMASPGRPESAKVNRMIHNDLQMWWKHDGKYFDYIDPNYTSPRPAGPNAFPYNSIGTAAHCPHWNYYQKEWTCKGLGNFVDELGARSRKERDRGQWVRGCLNCRSFMDFKLTQILYAINHPEMDIQHLYFDLVKRTLCNSSVHGCLWTDDFGRKWGSLDWECTRAFFQIIRKALLDKNPDGLISFHTHNQRLPMITSYCDMQVGGEDFVAELGAKGNYYGVVDSDTLLSYSVSYGMGPQCIFIPQFQRALDFVARGTKFDETMPKNKKAMRHLLVMLFIHDIEYWYSQPEARALTALKKSFGWDEETIFQPFWKTDGFFKILKDTTGGKLYVTIFRRKGRFLLAALNDSPNPTEAVIQLDMKRLLGGQPKSIKDHYQPERKHTLDDDKLTLNLQDREPAIIWFE